MKLYVHVLDMGIKYSMYCIRCEEKRKVSRFISSIRRFFFYSRARRAMLKKVEISITQDCLLTQENLHATYFGA